MRIKKIKNIIFLIIVVLLLSTFMKVFLFASFRTSTQSMEPTILAGDHILVNKLILGPRIYENWSFFKDSKIKMKRMPGLRSVKRNDVLVFDFPYKRYAPDKIIQGGNLYYIKRCVAIPGDTFFIDNGTYKVKGVSENLGDVKAQHELPQNQVNLTNKSYQSIFPKDTLNFRWTIKDFGPLYIPTKGDNLRIDSVSIGLYKNLIEYETDKSVCVKNGIVYLNDSIICDYTFLQNYYFVVGDYFFNSEDSRYWGLLPDDLVIGKAVVIWKSQDVSSGIYRWSRFFKIIK